MPLIYAHSAFFRSLMFKMVLCISLPHHEKNKMHARTHAIENYFKQNINKNYAFMNHEMMFFCGNCMCVRSARRQAYWVSSDVCSCRFSSSPSSSPLPSSINSRFAHTKRVIIIIVWRVASAIRCRLLILCNRWAPFSFYYYYYRFIHAFNWQVFRKALQRTLGSVAESCIYTGCGCWNQLPLNSS